MKNKDNRNIQERAEDLTKVLVFSIVSSIKRNYDNLNSFKKDYEEIVTGRADARQQVKFCSLFKHTNQEYRKILGQIDVNGKLEYVKIDDVLKHVSCWLHYRKNFTKHFKSGKSFAVHSYWYIDFDILERFFQKLDEILDTSSSFYSSKQHKLIDKVILKQKFERKTTKMKDAEINELCKHNDEEMTKRHHVLQDYIKRSILSVSEAKQIACACYNEDWKFDECNGITLADKFKNKEIRRNIFRKLLNKYVQIDKESNEYKLFITIANQ